MARFVVGDDRSQSTLFPERLDDYLGEIIRCGRSMFLPTRSQNSEAIKLEGPVDGKTRACRADTIHPLESKQIAGRIDHCDCRGRIPLARVLPRCLQNRLGSGLIKGQYVEGL